MFHKHVFYKNISFCKAYNAKIYNFVKGFK